MEKTKIEETKEYTYYLYKAKCTLWYFNNLINEGYDNYSCVKFKNSDNVYVWLENIKIEGEYYSGNLTENNQTFKVKIESVIDWMIIDNGRLLGGYTIRHYRNSLDDEAKLNFDIDFGVKIDFGNDFFKPDFSTPEGAIIMLENYYSDKNLDGILTCKNFIMEAYNLLKEKEILITEDLQSEVAEVLKLSLIENLQTNGFPDFKNIERVFMCIEKEENQQLIEEKIIHPNCVFSVNKFWVGYYKNEWKVLNSI